MSSMNRRLVVAACLVLAGAAVAAAVSAGSFDRFGTPAVQPGDRWVYNATGAVPFQEPYSLSGPWSVRGLAFHAGPDATGIDGEGRQRAGRQVDEVREYRYGAADDEDPVLIPVPSWHLVDGGAAVATETFWSRGGAMATNTIILPNGQELTTGDYYIVTETTVTFGVAAPLCGFEHSLQGRSASPADGLVVHGACGRWDGPSASQELQSLGKRDWQGRDVEAYGSGELEAWLDSTVPVPVHLRIGGTTFELSGYAPDAVPAARAFPLQQTPAVSFAPRTIAGPDESGIAHAFPLSAAFDAASTDPDAGLDRYLAAHPHAQVVEAGYIELVDEQQTPTEWTYRWSFTVSDGASAHGVKAELKEVGFKGPQPPAPVPPLPPGTPGGPFPDAVQDVAGSFDAVEVEVAPREWPAPGDLPAEMPTVASLVARWDSYKAEGRAEGNAWGFTAACGLPGEHDGCAGGEWLTWAGLSRRTSPVEVQVGIAIADGWTPEFSSLEVDGAGRSRVHAETWLAEPTAFDFGVFSLEGLTTTPPDWTRTAAVRLAEVPAPAAAIGAIATLAALLVVAWPWLKTGPLAGPLAFFSRVAPDRVLDNPRRAALLDLVEAEPGIHLRELARRLSLGDGAVRHHLAQLEAAGRIRAVRGPRYLCYFPAGRAAAVDRHVAGAAPLLKSDVARRLLERCAAEPGLSGQRLAADLGVTPGAVTYHVQRLAAAGLVQQRRLGRELLVETTALGRAAV